MKNYKWAAIWISALALSVGAGIWELKESSSLATSQSLHPQKYQCPMHPQVIQDHPGNCPICYMRLEKVEDGDSAEKSGSFAGISGKEGFKLSLERQQLIGVSSTPVEMKSLTLTVRMPGQVAPGGRILAQLLEIDGGTVRRGMKARIQGPMGAPLMAKVLEVGGSIDSLTRSYGVTLETSGRAPWLRPGAFCQVLVELNLGIKLAIPMEAVLDTGARQVVFVQGGSGHFEPRQVLLGQEGDEWIEVAQGLKAGERVVSSANFLIDSESRLQAALKQF